ncbi:MAG: nuclear transport factor 2 family protein [Pseudomonadota bacterium]
MSRFQRQSSSMMTPNEWAERWYQELWNESREDAIDELFAEDGVIQGGPAGPIRGREAMRDYHRRMTATFSEIDVVINQSMEWGSSAQLRYFLNVTHRHTGHRAGLECATWIQLEEGQLIEGRSYIDYLGLLQQLGLVPEDYFLRTLAADADPR